LQIFLFTKLHFTVSEFQPKLLRMCMPSLWPIGCTLA